MKNSKKGFTLVEMVAVIGIIIASAAIVVPSFSDMVSFSNKTADISAAGIIEHAIKMTSADIHGGKVDDVFKDVANPYDKSYFDIVNVEKALQVNGISREILTPKQSGCAFVYDIKADRIVVKKLKEINQDYYHFDGYTYLYDVTPYEKDK